MDSCFEDQTFAEGCTKPDLEQFQKSHLNVSNGFYTLPGILEFLQSEWLKMELERSEWAVERAEMQARIAFLQGECKGQENLKFDLVRRIKMLEYALIQERAKNFELKYPNETKIVTPYASDYLEYPDKRETRSQKDQTQSTVWCQDRERLKEYLINAGLGNSMEQLRKVRIRDLWTYVTSENTDETTQERSHDVIPSDAVSFNLDSPLSRSEDKENGVSPVLPELSKDGPSPVNISEAFPSLAELDKSVVDLGDTLDETDPATAEALAEFELLVAQQGNTDPFSRLSDPNDPLAELPKERHFASTEWDTVDEVELFTRFMDQYRAERPRVSRPSGNSRGMGINKHPDGTREMELSQEFDLTGDIDVKRPSPNLFTTTSNPISCDEVDEVALDYDAMPPDKRAFSNQLDPWTARETSSDMVAATESNLARTAARIDGSVDPTTLGLGDLASLTVANEVDCGHTRSVSTVMDKLDGVGDMVHSNGSLASTFPATDSTSSPDTTLWTAKYTLRSHFDAIRTIAFHHSEAMLVTGSEDHTLKLWNLNKTVQAKKSTNFDVEPVYTFRGHESPVLSLVMWSAPETSPQMVISGDLRGRLRTWRLYNLQPDPYDVFDPVVNGPSLRGHTNAIWSLTLRPDGVLLSASADGTACLWPLGSIKTSHLSTLWIPASNVFQLTTSLMTTTVTKSEDFCARPPIPTSVTFLQTDKNRFLAGFTSGQIGLFDVESSLLLNTFQTELSSADTAVSRPGGVTSIVTHPQHALAISAHEDRQIRFHDLNSGKCVHNMVAHLDVVTALSIDSQGVHLLSSSHDCSIRLWNINKKTCIQEITSHRKKFGESIHAVTFHPTKHLMASAGADALAKVFT